MKNIEPFSEVENDRPVGIGPVIAGWDGAEPVYYVDLVYASGETRRLTWKKSSPRADRQAKLAAIRERINLANRLRPNGGVVLAHDQDSFSGLVTVLSRLSGRGGAMAASVTAAAVSAIC